MKLRQRLYVRLKEELRTTEYEIHVFKQGLFLDEEEAKDVDEKFTDNLMNYLTSLDKHGDVVAEASNEKTHIFESDPLCMVAGDE